MPQYQTTTPPDEVTEELIRAVIEDARLHLETRLAETREYVMRRVRARCQELRANGEQLDLRRKKKQPIIVDWRVPGGNVPPDEREHYVETQKSEG